MKNTIILFVISLGLISSCRVAKVQSDAKPITHEAFTTELQKFVTDEGWVDYEAWQKDTSGLKSYLAKLEQHHPNKSWTDDEQMAYWINAYNAYTALIVLRNFPVESIKDIKDGIPFVNTVWDIKFITIEGHDYDLNNLEHGILRKHFDDARIHFAVNCASVSCPPLLDVAFEAKTLDQQLDQQAKRFINDPSRNKISENKLKLSKIFTWFSGDFTDKKPIKEWIRQYSDTEFAKDPEIEYLDYDWGINGLR